MLRILHGGSTLCDGVTRREAIVEPLARNFIALLAERLDADGSTTVVYWACSASIFS